MKILEPEEYKDKFDLRGGKELENSLCAEFPLKVLNCTKFTLKLKEYLEKDVEF